MSETEPIVVLTDEAKRRVLEVRAAAAEPENMALWVEVAGMTAGMVSYSVYFDGVQHARKGDAVHRENDVTVVVPSHSIGRLHGSIVDVGRADPMLVVRSSNQDLSPRSSPPIGIRSPVALSGDLAHKIVQVLEEQVNPSIAVHGGRAELVSVEDGRAYVRMGGSCVGCALAAETLDDGIAAAIRQALPEVESVIDVTNHASGTNPFYEVPTQ